MNGYDWQYGFGFGRGPMQREGRFGQNAGRGYDRGFGRPGGRMGSDQGGGGRGGYARDFRPMGGGFGRGEYGPSYPSFGGYPGSQQRGMYSGGAPAGRYDTGYGMNRPRGYDQGFGEGRGGQRPNMGRYDASFAREPFVPEAAYQRHPELGRPQIHHADRWPGRGDAGGGSSEQLSDDEIRQAVRERMYQDTWVDADRIEVSVDGGVVTLRGEVNDYLEARYAWDDAWEAEGVHGVVNQLTVRIDDASAEHHGDLVPQTGGKSGTTR